MEQALNLGAISVLVIVLAAVLFTKLSVFRKGMGHRGRALLVAVVFFFPLLFAPGPLTGQVKPGDSLANKAPDVYVFEAQRNLVAINDAQTEYFIKNNHWAGYPDGTGAFKSLKWRPGKDFHYAYYCGNDSLIPEKSAFDFDYPSPLADWPYGVYPDVSLSDYTCLAVANNDRDAFPDVWMINKYRAPLHLLSDATNEVVSSVVNEPYDPWRLGPEGVKPEKAAGEGNVYIEINLPAYRLDLYVAGKRVKSYPVAIGMSRFKTPMRSFELERMEWNPWWIPPNASWCKKKDEEGNITGCKPVGPGPSNPLGPVKMPLGSGYLIHGTNKPKSIGKRSSHGCIRMRSANAIDLAWKLMVLAGTNQPIVDKELFNVRSRRTYVVYLLNHVQVNTVYKRLEVMDGALLIHPDTYRRQRIGRAKLKNRLVDFGFSDKTAERFSRGMYSENMSEPMRIPITFRQ